MEYLLYVCLALSKATNHDAVPNLIGCCRDMGNLYVRNVFWEPYGDANLDIFNECCRGAADPLRTRQWNVYFRQTLRADFLNAVYFRRGLTCALGLTNDLIDGGQLRAKPRVEIQMTKT